ncbi:efflux RND transporter permease subunit, partial [Desulfobacterales bacterium HSG17]|nr:efflux RND transporter permease subunit [Desulfobacterales bacterium HSG17]
MIISDTAIKNRTSVVVLSVIIFAIGIYCYMVLPREATPDITIPNVFISTSYKGVSATDIETSITIPIEKKLKGLDRVKNIKSISREGTSQINIEFIPDTDIDEVLQKVRDKVDEAKGDLPGDLENDPAVFEVNFSEIPIVVYSLSGTCGLSALKQIADDIEEDIEAIPGVLEVDVTGGLEREIKIEVDPDKLAYYRIPIIALQAVVSGENSNTSGGSITLGDGRYQLRVPGEFESPDEIYNLVITSYEGKPIYLKDLAYVRDGFKDETSRSRLDGLDAINISVKKRVGENIIEISDQIEILIANSQPAWPKGTVITKLMDQAKEVRLMVADLENNILTGLILVILVLLFILGIRNAVLVALSIPFSMLMSFTILYGLGISLNNVVLFALTLALGMLVDNAIVIVENVYRYYEQGVPRIQAAMKATSEVAYPVIGSTLTTLAAFSPMIFWPGIMGGFMKYLPITLIITLSSSLFVALVINPALTAIFVRVTPGKRKKTAKSADEVATAGEKPIAIEGVILKSYAGFLTTALNNRIVVVIISFITLFIMVFTWLMTIGLRKPVEFFPSLDPRSIYVNIDPPKGADLDFLDRIVKNVEMAICGYSLNDTNDFYPLADYDNAFVPQEHQMKNGKTYLGPSDLDNIDHIYAKAVESAGGGGGFGENLPNHIGVQFLDLEDRTRPTTATLEDIRERVKYIAGARILVTEAEQGPPTGSPINIEISGDNFQQLGAIAKKIRSIVAKVKFTEDIQDDYVAGLPSIRVRIDRQKAAMFGLSTNAIGFSLKTAYNGLEVSSYREGDEDYDITVVLSKKDRSVTDVLYKLMIPTPSGQLVPLKTLATIDYSGSLGDIVRINHNRVVTVKANVDETKIPGAVARAEAEALLKDFPLPSGYDIKFTGEFEFQQESQAFLQKTFTIAIFLIFLILVTLFNSVTQPAIILTSVVLSLGGAFLGLTVIRSPFGIIMTGVGVISLAGVVVNNAIVLIDYTNKLLQRGMPIKEAIVSAGATRLRPVLLTAVTTILGLLPMVTGTSYDFHKMAIAWESESTQWWKNMAAVVIFGLMVATFLTLVVVPVLYSLLADANRVSRKAKERIQSIYWKPFG